MLLNLIKPQMVPTESFQDIKLTKAQCLIENLFKGVILNDDIKVYLQDYHLYRDLSNLNNNNDTKKFDIIEHLDLYESLTLFELENIIL